MPATTCSQRSSMPSISIRWASMMRGSGRGLGKPRLADHGDLYRARILQLALDPAPELLRNLPRLVVRDPRGGDDDPDLAAGLDREGLLDALDGQREVLQPLEPLDVALRGLRAGAGPRGGDRVREDHDARVDRLGLHLLVVGRDRVDDDRGLAVALYEFGAYRRMASLHLPGDRLADVVEEAGPLGQVGIQADLARDQRGEERRLDRVVEHVLVVGETVPELPEKLYDLRVKAVDVEPADGVLAGLGRGEIDLVLGPLHVLLDACRMDPPVLDQRLEGIPGDFAAHGIKRREEDKLGRLVDQQRDSRRGLEGLYVAALPADEPALHLLARQVDEGRREVRVGLARQPLHRGDQYPARLGLQLLLRLLQGIAAQGPQLVLALEEHLLAQLLSHLLPVELRHALEPLAHVLG